MMHPPAKKAVALGTSIRKRDPNREDSRLGACNALPLSMFHVSE